MVQYLRHHLIFFKKFIKVNVTIVRDEVPHMTRWKASGLHFLLSLFIAVVAVIVVILVMCPPSYTGSTGAGKLLVALIGVDVTLGR